MFTTVEEIKELTGYDVTPTLLSRAQALIESYVGRLEIEVDAARDLQMLGRATAYQAAYMLDNDDVIFKQMDATQIMQFGQQVTFSQGGSSPWIAPLARLTCSKLSWRRMRSVRTGSIFDVGVSRKWATD